VIAPHEDWPAQDCQDQSQHCHAAQAQGIRQEEPDQRGKAQAQPLKKLRPGERGALLEH
jgi:hypothetical protein